MSSPAPRGHKHRQVGPAVRVKVLLLQYWFYLEQNMEHSMPRVLKKKKKSDLSQQSGKDNTAAILKSLLIKAGNKLAGQPQN